MHLENQIVAKGSMEDHYPTIYLPNGSLPIIQEMPKQQTYVVMAVAGMVSHSGSIGL